MEQVCERITYRFICWLYFPNLPCINMHATRYEIFMVVCMHVIELWVMATFYLVCGDESYGGTSHVATTQTLGAET